MTISSIYQPNVQQDLRNAASYINGQLSRSELTANLNSRNQIEVKTDNGVILKRIEGVDVAKKMSHSRIDTYV